MVMSLILLFAILFVGTASGRDASLLRLKYFDAKGAAEVSRVLLHLANITYEDIRLPLRQKIEGGYEMTEFQAAKERGDFAVNMDRVPVLEIGDTIIGQSRAIERYLAQKCGFMGQNAEEAAVIDCIAENIRDIKDRWAKIRTTGGFGPNPEKDKLLDKWFHGGELAEWLSKLEKSLPAGKEGVFTLGDSLSYADIAIWHLLRDYFGPAHDLPAIEHKARVMRLSEIADRVGDIAELKTYLAQRPQTPF